MSKATLLVKGVKKLPASAQELRFSDSGDSHQAEIETNTRFSCPGGEKSCVAMDDD